ncbi:MAG: pitrilysin family protein [Porphyromonas sp.]|nr:pitrilysin family protein [Porphyromonas sp.]
MVHITQPYYTHTLPNGLRLALLPTRSKVVYCGFAIKSGSRNDPTQLPGLAHLVEHMLFKGTTHRRAWHILNRMERVGGELNAYTSKEDTFVYTTAPRRELVRSIELLGDLVRYSTYPQHELDRERVVVADEINLYKDTPSEQIFDDFEELFFQDYPLAHPILGSAESLVKMGSDDCRLYAEQAFVPSRMVFFCMGQVTEQRFVELAERYLMEGFYPELHTTTSQEAVPPKTTAFTLRRDTKTHQAHALIGAVAPNLHDDRRKEMALLMNILGGSSMNSQLNLLLRERRGWVYGVDASYTSLSDVGWWQIYFGSDPVHAERALEVVRDELERIRRDGLSQSLLRRWIKQSSGQLALSSEQSESTFLNFGRQILHRDSYQTVHEAIAQLERMTPEQLMSVAEEVLVPERMSLLLYKGGAATGEDGE